MAEAIPHKVLSRLATDFVEKAETLDNDELKKRIAECEKILVSTKKDMKADPKLASLKEEVKECASVYKDTILDQHAMIAVYVNLLDGRGAI